MPRLANTGAAAALVLASCAGVTSCASSDHPPTPTPITLLTLNVANGAGASYRSPAARARQAAFIAGAGADLVALQEVDLNVERSGHADCAREVARLECSVVEPFTVDGVRRCDGTGTTGVVLFGRAFAGDDPFDAVNGVPSGIISEDPPSADRSAEASFGVALVARARIRDTYVVQLPTDAAQVADDPLYARLALDPPPDSARADLAERNVALRRGRAIEPRVVLVARIPRAGARALSVLVTHLESADPTGAVRARQLDRVLAVAKAERAGPPARDVVVLGDLNQTARDSTSRMTAAGLRLAAAPSDDQAVLDQIWIDGSLELVRAGQVPTDGVSDHPFAALAVVR